MTTKETILTAEEFRTRMTDMDSRMLELENIKNPLTVSGRIEHAMSQIEELTDKVSEVMRKMKAFDFDERFLELFTDEQIYKYYEQSGIRMNEMKDFISKNFFKGKEVSLPTASNYVNGQIKDLKIRSILGKHLRHYVAQK